ncbi:cytidine and deoxycytidylate deaminase related protein [Cystoisospora suis]|uniref:Cytidine and deoxycytidylate deaminase related protein n=1 Tax=Cystoisospora suis TaxID=483139 RepID=A0A2C6KXY9_9APIC|nr:cytidine and deoxycytidylate deaminase related protein [Cystoisospora suis]
MSLLDAEPTSRIEAVYFKIVDRVFQKLRGDNFTVIDRETAEAFSRAWKQQIRRQLGNPLAPTPRAEERRRDLHLSKNRNSLPCSPTLPKRTRNTQGTEEDDDFEDACVDQPLETPEQDSAGVYLSEEEVQYLVGAGRGVLPALDDLTDRDAGDPLDGLVLGSFEKVMRPAETGKRASDGRPACWTLTIRDGVMKVAGREFVFDRIDAEAKEN